MTRPILDTVVQYLQEDGWLFGQVLDKPIFRLVYNGHNGVLLCHAVALDERDQFIFCSSYFPGVPPERRLAMAELLTRINFDLVIGSFAMDFSDGEVRFRTSIDVEGDRLTVALARQVVYSNLTTMDYYLPAIISVAFDDTEPTQALAKIREQLKEE